MQPVIIGIRKELLKKNNDLPNINGFMYKPIKNKIHFPHKGPIVLITDIRDTLLPGEQVILGPYCDCVECLNEKYKTSIANDTAKQNHVKNRGTIVSRPKVIKNNQIYTSTPNEEKSKSVDSKRSPTAPTNVQDNINISHNSNDVRNIQRSQKLEFSEIDSDSGWEKRQELLTRLTRDLEEQVDTQLKLEVSKKELKPANNIEAIIDDQQNYEVSRTKTKKGKINSVSTGFNSSVARYGLRGKTKNTAKNDVHEFKVPKTAPKPKQSLRISLKDENLKGTKSSKRKRQAPTENDKEVIPTPQVERLRAHGKRRTLYSPSNTTFYEQSLFGDLGE